MTFYGKIFRGVLSVQTKHFAAHVTSHDNFFTPTLGGHNLHNSISTNFELPLILLQVLERPRVGVKIFPHANWALKIFPVK